MAFQNIFTDGVLVDINISKWTAERLLQPEDLGLRKEQIPDTFKLGHKCLIPRDVIRSFHNMDYEARNLLTGYSFPFAFGGARFVPKKMFLEYSTKMEDLKKKFYTSVEDFLVNYENYKLAVRPEYIKAGQAAYERMKKMGYAPVDREGYVGQFLERVNTFYPSADKMRTKFKMEYVVFQVSLPDLTQVSIDDVVADSEKAEMVKEVYKEALYDKIKNYVGDIIGDLRGKAQKILESLRRSIKESRRLTVSSFNMVKDMINEYERMNIIGDDYFLNQLISFRNKFIENNDPKKLRSNKTLRQEMILELDRLSVLVFDRSSIDTVAEAYRQKISL
jgi:hypothetical protein